MRLPRFLVLAAAILAIASGGSPTYAEVRIGIVVPLTGSLAWGGVEMREGAEIAVADLNARGGVLSERIEIVAADDYCHSDQAIAAANKLIAAKVAVVVGHPCSSAALSASKVYFEAGLLMISTFATIPKLTEQGFWNVFRVVGRDDLQGRIAGDLLAERWGAKPIAILHDGQDYGKGLAQEVKNRLNERGTAEAIFEAVEPGKADYWDIIQKMRTRGVQVLYYGGYQYEAGLIIRQAREHGYQLQLVAGDAISSEDFGLIAGPASDGTLITFPAAPSGPGAAELAAKFTEGVRNPSTAYAALQVWAQAVEMTGTFESKAMADALRSHEFDTVLGRIGFDEKGDVIGYETFVWNVWKDGKFAPIEPGTQTELRPSPATAYGRQR